MSAVKIGGEHASNQNFSMLLSQAHAPKVLKVYPKQGNQAWAPCPPYLRMLLNLAAVAVYCVSRSAYRARVLKRPLGT